MSAPLIDRLRATAAILPPCSLRGCAELMQEAAEQLEVQGRAVRAAQALEDTLGNWTELRSSDPLVTALREALAPFAAPAAPEETQ